MSKYCCNIDHKRVVALGGGARTLVISAFFIPLFFLSSSEAYSEDGIKSMIEFITVVEILEM